MAEFALEIPVLANQGKAGVAVPEIALGYDLESGGHMTAVALGSQPPLVNVVVAIAARGVGQRLELGTHGAMLITGQLETLRLMTTFALHIRVFSVQGEGRDDMVEAYRRFPTPGLVTSLAIDSKITLVIVDMTG